MTQTTQKNSIEFMLQLSPEKYEVIKTLAKLQGLTVQEYIYDNIVNIAPALIDNIEDDKEREHAKKTWDRERVTMSMMETTLLHCELEAEPEQIAAIEKIAKENNMTRYHCLEHMVYNWAFAQMDHLGYFDGTRDMEQTLKED